MWADKFLLCSSGVSHFFGDALKVVDLITWDKGRIGMGYRSH
jgi:site-specific DNA-methyltransferase (adenine-specific)